MGVKFERKIINVNVGDFSCQNEGNFKISKARPAIQAGEMGAGCTMYDFHNSADTLKF